MANPKTPLVPKLASQFRLAVRCYENKEYKKGLKAINSILEKEKSHGESMAIKGLLLNCMGKKEEAYDWTKKGLRACITSHVCWHVYGLLYRSDRNYPEAVRCYRNAIKRDPENIQILRDLACLQVQVRDLEGFLTSRHEMLTLKGGNPSNWLTLGVALQLLGEYDAAICVLDTFDRLTGDKSSNKVNEDRVDLDKNERKLHLIYLHEQAGKFDEALKLLETYDNDILDKLAAKEQKARILLALGRKEEATDIYKGLIEFNVECQAYHDGLAKSLDLSPAADGTYTAEQIKALTELYDGLLEKNPKSSTIKRRQLAFLPSGAEFEAKLRAYVLPAILKGVPSLFATLGNLYHDADKVAAIGSLAEECLASFEKDSRLPGSEQDDPPNTILWVLFFLAKHSDKLGNTTKALELIDRALEHTPTVEELYMGKASIYKHAGAVEKATVELEKARRLDLADRFINTKSTKYLLRSNAVDRAQSTIEQFTRDADNDNRSNLIDMQCMWYELERADAYIRKGEYGPALKMIAALEKNFDDINEDQFDFHHYCIRKMTLRAYTKMLTMEDGLYAHPNFAHTARSLIQIRLALHDTPPKTAEEQEEERLFEGLTGSALKKAKSKHRKAQLRLAAQKAKEDAEAAKKKSQESSRKKVKDEDTDPNGVKLLMIDDQLGDALRVLKIIEKSRPQSLETHTLGVEVYLRRKRLAAAVRAAKKAVEIAPNNPSSFLAVVRTFSAPREGARDLVKEVVAAEEKSILGGKSLKDYVSAYVANNTASLQERLAGAEALLLLDSSATAEASKLVQDLSGSGVTPRAVVESVRRIKKVFGKEEAEKFGKAAQEKFPLAEGLVDDGKSPLKEFLDAHQEDDDITNPPLNKRNR